MQKIGNMYSGQHPVFLYRVASYEDISSIPMTARKTVIFLGGDASEVAADILARAAHHLLAGEPVSVCTWGPDCERVHDIFDECYVGDGITVPMFNLCMTTWHSRQTFEDAVEYFATSAVPADGESEDVSYTAILVGSLRSNEDFQEAIRDFLSAFP